MFLFLFLEQCCCCLCCLIKDIGTIYLLIIIILLFQKPLNLTGSCFLIFIFIFFRKSKQNAAETEGDAMLKLLFLKGCECLSPFSNNSICCKKEKKRIQLTALPQKMTRSRFEKSADLIEVLWPRLLGEPKSEAANKASILTTAIRPEPRTSGPHGCIVSCLRFLLSHWPVRPTASISRFPLSPKAATIAELSTRRKSICLPLTHVAHPSLQVLLRPSGD